MSFNRLGMGDVRVSLCGERAALNQGGETGIGSKFVPFRIHVKEREVHIVNVQGVVQTVQRCFCLPKASVHQRLGVRRYVAFLRNHFQRTQDFTRLSDAPNFREYVATQPDDLAICTVEPSGFLECVQSHIIGVTQLLIRHSALVITDPEFWIENIRPTRKFSERRSGSPAR